MPTCVPIKDLKDTAAFTKTIEGATGPVTVTRNGYDAFVVMRTGDYEAMQEELARTRLFLRIARAEKEHASGQSSDGAAFVDEMRQQHGL